MVIWGMAIIIIYEPSSPYRFSCLLGTSAKGLDGFVTPEDLAGQSEHRKSEGAPQWEESHFNHQFFHLMRICILNQLLLASLLSIL